MSIQSLTYDMYRYLLEVCRSDDFIRGLDISPDEKINVYNHLNYFNNCCYHLPTYTWDIKISDTTPSMINILGIYSENMYNKFFNSYNMEMLNKCYEVLRPYVNY